MKTYLRKIVAFINDEEGASAIEYGLLVGLIALAIIAGATLLGTKYQHYVYRCRNQVRCRHRNINGLPTYGGRGRSLRASAPLLREKSALPRA